MFAVCIYFYNSVTASNNRIVCVNLKVTININYTLRHGNNTIGITRRSSFCINISIVSIDY